MNSSAAFPRPPRFAPRTRIHHLAASAGPGGPGAVRAKKITRTGESLISIDIPRVVRVVRAKYNNNAHARAFTRAFTRKYISNYILFLLKITQTTRTTFDFIEDSPGPGARTSPDHPDQGGRREWESRN
jgi:hypothetical protein